MLSAVVLAALLLTACQPAPVATKAPAPTEAPTKAATEAPTAAPTEAPAKVGETYKIGFAPSITGGAASLGDPEHQTGKMLAEQLKETGVMGPDGVMHPVEIIIYDEESNPDVAVSVVRKMIEEDKVQIVVAGTGSGASMAIVPIVTEAEVPYISMASAGAIVKDPATSEVRKWVFKTAQDNKASATWQADYITAMGWTSVCHIYQNSGYGNDTFKQATAVFEAAKITIAYSAPFESAATEFPELAEVGTSKCQAVVVGALPPASSTVSVAIREQYPDMPIIHGHGTCNQDHIDLMGDVAEGMVSPCGKVMVAEILPDGDPQKEVAKQYAADYTAFTGKPVNTFGGHGWDALTLAVKALESLPDGLDLKAQRAAARDYLETGVKDWPGISGLYNLSPEDHFSLDYKSLVFVKVVDGKWIYFPPEEWKK
jgi:branched-chain amino acid transport system substrate-binding protein